MVTAVHTELHRLIGDVRRTDFNYSKWIRISMNTKTIEQKEVVREDL